MSAAAGSSSLIPITAGGFFSRLMNTRGLTDIGWEILTVRVKQYMSLIIETFMIQSNTSRIVYCISGGEAFNFYFKSNRTIETHDYDVKIVLLNQDDYNISGIRKILEDSRQNFMDGLIPLLNTAATELNAVISTNSPDNGFYKTRNLIEGSFYKKSYNSTGVYDPTQFINVICYDFQYMDENGKDRHMEGEGIVDLGIPMPYEIRKEIGFSFNSLLDQIPTKDKVIQTDTSLDRLIEYSGFIKEMLVPVVSVDTGLYYIKLGYLVWDTVRILNRSFMAVKTCQTRPNDYPICDQGLVKKLERYGKKYRLLIDALNDPSKFMRCEALQEYTQKCASQLKSEGCSVKTIQEVFKEGTARGLFPLTYQQYVSNLETTKQLPSTIKGLVCYEAERTNAMNEQLGNELMSLANNEGYTIKN